VTSRYWLLALVVGPAVFAQTLSTRCQTAPASAEVRLIGCGEGFPDNLLWHLDRADSVDGTLDSHVTRKATGRGTVVYMIDTGVMRDHDEFTRSTGSVVIGSLTVGATSTRCGVGHDPALEPCFSNIPELTIYGHGTATASMVAGKNTGVAPDARIVSVYGDSLGNSIVSWMAGLDLIIRHAFDPQTPQFKTGIISMSFVPNFANANDPLFPQFEAKVRRMIAGVDASGNPDPNGKRFVFVVIAGNYLAGASNQCDAAKNSNLYPSVLGGKIEGLITVGGIDETSAVWDGSCRGDAVDVFAPAAHLLVASIGARDHYRTAPLDSGTSYAAPYVSGLAALLLEKNPNLAPVEIERMIKSSPSLVTHAEDGTAGGRVAVFDWVMRQGTRRHAAH
jgi:subtilisin family serine protease